MSESINIIAVVVAGIILLLFLSALAYLPVFATKHWRNGNSKRSVLSGVVWLLLVCGVMRTVYAFMPGKSVIIARTTTPAGVDLCVTHKSNYSPEPYTVSFYFKRPNQPWGWFYYEHEDTRWFRGSIELNDEGTMASIKRGRTVVATFDLISDSFTIIRWKRTTKGAQEWMPGDWTPEQEIGKDT